QTLGAANDGEQGRCSSQAGHPLTLKSSLPECAMSTPVNDHKKVLSGRCGGSRHAFTGRGAGGAAQAVPAGGRRAGRARGGASAAITASAAAAATAPARAVPRTPGTGSRAPPSRAPPAMPTLNAAATQADPTPGKVGRWTG